MVVDDHAPFRAVLKALLAQTGAEVTECGSASEALRRLDEFQPDWVSMDIEMPGLDGSMTTAGWLWDRQIAAIAADNVALEAMRVDPEVGFQHRRIIAMLGMPLGELWDLDELAEDCAEDSRYEFMLTSAPLYIPGGVGSPINAYALK